ncbi:MAG: transposase [Planctomycetota bacterium]
MLKPLLELLDTLEVQIRELNKRIAEEGRKDPAVARLSTIPGIGEILGNVIATEIDGVGRVNASEYLCAYAGLIPSTSSSGDKTCHGRLVSGCNKWLRWARVEGARVAVGCDPCFGGLYRHHRSRGNKANTAIMIVARRMCQIIYRILREDRAYQPRTWTPTFPGRSQHGRTERAA